MEFFWLWFIRPLAEFLGVIFLIALLYGAIIGFFKFTEWKRSRDMKNGKK